MEHQHAIDIVGKLQEEFSHLDLDFLFELHYMTNGDAAIIRFMDIDIWSSENDQREWIDDSGRVEPLEPFVRRQLNKMISEISKLKF